MLIGIGGLRRVNHGVQRTRSSQQNALDHRGGRAFQLYRIVSSAHRHHLVVYDYLEDVLAKLPDVDRGHIQWGLFRIWDSVRSTKVAVRVFLPTRN